MARHMLTYPALVERGLFGNRVTLLRAIKRYGFPTPYRLGARRVVWDEAEVNAWLNSRKGLPMGAESSGFF